MYSSLSAATAMNRERAAPVSTSRKICGTGGESHNCMWSFGNAPLAYAPIGRNIVRNFAPRIHDEEPIATVPSPASLLQSQDAEVHVFAPQPQMFVTGRVSKFCGNSGCAFAASCR